MILLGSLDFLESSFAIFRISMHSKLRRKWEKSSNCSTRETFVGCRLKRDSAEMIVAKIFAINKAAGKRDAHARRRTCSYNTIVRFWQTHNLLQSKNINDTLWDCSTPSFFFSRVWKGWEMDQKIWRPKHNMFHHWTEGRRGQKNSVFFKDITKSQVNPSSQFLSKVTRITKLLQFVSQIGILQKVLREQRMKLILPIWLCFSKVLLSPC